MIDRLIAPRLRNSRKSILLIGPRQVGKSTLCRSLKPIKTINLADESLYLSYSKDAGLLSRELKSLTKPGIVVIDEIQRVPSLLNTLQAYLDEKPRHRFILTGSSARKLKRGGANLLPGRIILEYLDPLTIWELGSRFDLEKCLSWGSLPGIYTDEEERGNVLSTYAQVYLREEIQAEAVTKNIGAYGRFLDIAAEASGQWINYSKIASDAEIPKETIRRFYRILEETLIAIRIPPFRVRGGNRRITQRDRFIFFDIGVRNALLGINGQSLPPREKGFLFEQWMIQQCLSFSRIHHTNWKISTFRTDSGLEVDVVLDLGNSFLAIECKYSRNVSARDGAGLRAFENLVSKPVRKILVYSGQTEQKFSDGEIAVPYQKFLLETLTSLI